MKWYSSAATFFGVFCAGGIATPFCIIISTATAGGRVSGGATVAQIFSTPAMAMHQETNDQKKKKTTPLQKQKVTSKFL